MNSNSQKTKAKLQENNVFWWTIRIFFTLLVGVIAVVIAIWLVKNLPFWFKDSYYASTGCKERPTIFMDGQFDAFYYNEGVFTAISVITLFLSYLLSMLYYYWREKKKSDFSKGQFLTTLGNEYIKSKDFEKIYQLLDKAFLYSQMENSPPAQVDEIERRLHNLCRKKYATISNYLSFFEVFKILIEKQMIDIESFDDLFAYRFFLAARNVVIRKYTMDHPFRKNYFRNIIELEEHWLKYRKKYFKKAKKDDPFAKTYFYPEFEPKGEAIDQKYAGEAFEMREKMLESIKATPYLFVVDDGIKTLEEFTGFFPGEQTQAEEGSKQPFVRGIIKSGKLAAYAIVSFRSKPLKNNFRDENGKTIDDCTEENGAYIEMVLVDPSHQGKGYQKVLLQDIEKKLRDEGNVQYIGAIVCPENFASYMSFIESGYKSSPVFEYKPGYRRVSVVKNLKEPAKEKEQR